MKRTIAALALLALSSFGTAAPAQADHTISRANTYRAKPCYVTRTRATIYDHAYQVKVYVCNDSTGTRYAVLDLSNLTNNIESIKGFVLPRDVTRIFVKFLDGQTLDQTYAFSGVDE